MTDPRIDAMADDSALLPYRGAVERPRPVFEEHVAMWDSTVSVTPLDLPGMGRRFEVRVTRFGGPKLSGTPDAVGVRIAQVDDAAMERQLDRARELALRAVEELRAGRAPDLKELAERVRGGPSRAADL